jgi:hypothetical protein
MVSGGGRYATSDIQIFGEAALWALSVVGRTRGDCLASCTALWPARDRTPARQVRLDNIPRDSAQCSETWWRAGVSRNDAEWHAERSARRPKSAKLVENALLRSYVEEKLTGVVTSSSGVSIFGPTVSWKGRRHGKRQDRRWARAWSPEQIARRLPIDFPDDETMRISHEAMYQALFIQGRGALRRELTACLRTGRALRTPRARSRGRGKAFISPEIMISQRPAEVADRAVPGHWEGDLILGLGNSAIGALVERTT